MYSVEAICIPNYEERQHPKPHVVFRVEVTARVRKWQVWRRYSEFVDLDTELRRCTKLSPPEQLPSKHTLPFLVSTEKALEQRRQGLESYLIAILISDESTWRSSIAFKDFLCLPKSTPGSDGVDIIMGSTKSSPKPMPLSSLDDGSITGTLEEDSSESIPRSGLEDVDSLMERMKKNIEEMKRDTAEERAALEKLKAKFPEYVAPIPVARHLADGKPEPESVPAQESKSISNVTKDPMMVGEASRSINLSVACIFALAAFAIWLYAEAK